ncbi:MAG: MMPL family transporter, partial [Bythopirellula sp.]
GQAVSPAAGRELWRLSARVAALGENSEGVDYGDFVKELKTAVDPILVAYQQRDMIVTALHESDKQLDGSQLCILYRTRDDHPEPQETTQESVLAKLLKRSGVESRVLEDGSRSTGVTTYNLAKLDEHENDGEYLDRVIGLLGKQDALILVSASSDPRAKDLANGGLNVIDVSNVPVFEASAAVPLAADNGPRPIRAVYTGMIPLVYKTQRQLLVSLNESIMWATVLIAVVMMFVLRSPMAGLISMIPNVFPIIMIFGALGWLGIKVDIGIMMTASVALGVAVDDTVHFLTWFRRGVKQGLNRVQAVMLAYDRCATAMLQTTIIGGLGLAVFATSTFTPTQQFGYLMISMLGAALIGDLLLLPAILAGPLGVFFGGKAPEAGVATEWGTSPLLDDAQDLPTTEAVRLRDEPPALDESTVDPVGSEVIQAALKTDQPHDVLEGPHAALHAKLRSLRRGESPQDSVSSQ